MRLQDVAGAPMKRYNTINNLAHLGRQVVVFFLIKCISVFQTREAEGGVRLPPVGAECGGQSHEHVPVALNWVVVDLGQAVPCPGHDLVQFWVP